MNKDMPPNQNDKPSQGEIESVLKKLEELNGSPDAPKKGDIGIESTQEEDQKVVQELLEEIAVHVPKQSSEEMLPPPLDTNSTDSDETLDAIKGLARKDSETGIRIEKNIQPDLDEALRVRDVLERKIRKGEEESQRKIRIQEREQREDHDADVELDEEAKKRIEEAMAEDEKKKDEK